MLMMPVIINLISVIIIITIIIIIFIIFIISIIIIIIIIIVIVNTFMIWSFLWTFPIGICVISAFLCLRFLLFL